ncbi:hypothetical protein F2P45_04580 [Massilia sp. CCM 8733]|uniref:Uncharacterized protein n=1 Tax=Massilia mucilaginosa TaxID=2609282 RepID=A0ABX0NNE9_9BURK|nr:hypothetical protein [Massilia mucilaginosa]NHZ88305.1 hypothetical protein [Massilia mucilaginosa]
MAVNITFRTQLLGGVAEFCHSSKLPFLANSLHLVELVVLLARYMEEGVKLVPKVYLTDDMKLLSAMLPGGERMKIGSTSRDVDGLKTAIKKCAPLAAGGWMIYIEDLAGTIEYGVFKDSGNPIAVLVDQVLMSENNPFSVVKVFQVADECVEIRSNQGAFHYVFLNHRKEDAAPPLQFLDELVLAIVARTDSNVREAAHGYVTRLLFDTLRKSHGCIIAVTDLEQPPGFLAEDGVIFDEPIDFPALINEFKKDPAQQSRLESKGYLLQGMLNSDGIILFDSSGRLLGYNCFVKLEPEATAAAGVVQGGARRRAFRSLSAKVGHDLRAAFMQSQDGWSEFNGSEHG